MSKQMVFKAVYGLSFIHNCAAWVRPENVMSMAEKYRLTCAIIEFMSPNNILQLKYCNTCIHKDTESCFIWIFLQISRPKFNYCMSKQMVFKAVYGFSFLHKCAARVRSENVMSMTENHRLTCAIIEFMSPNTSRS